jgi:hypothetical protein
VARAAVVHERDRGAGADRGALPSAPGTGTSTPSTATTAAAATNAARSSGAKNGSRNS